MTTRDNRTPVLDRVITIRQEVQTSAPGVPLERRHNLRRNFEPSTPGQWGVRGVVAGDSLDDHAAATTVELALTDADGEVLPSIVAPFPMAFAWSDGRSITWGVTEVRGYLDIYGRTVVGLSFDVADGVVTGVGTTAPPAGAIAVTIGDTDDITTTSEEDVEVWCSRRDVTIRDQLTFGAGLITAISGTIYTVRAQDGIVWTVDPDRTFVDDRGQERTIRGIVEMNRCFLELYTLLVA